MSFLPDAAEYPQTVTKYKYTATTTQPLKKEKVNSDTIIYFVIRTMPIAEELGNIEYTLR